MGGDVIRQKLRRARGAVAALLLLALAGVPAEAARRRAGGNDLFLGVGFMGTDEATIDGSLYTEQEDSDGFAVRWRFHFTDHVALEADLSFQSGRVRTFDGSFELDSRSADTSFFLIGGVVNLTRTAVSPYLSAGFGSFDHETDDILVPVGPGQYVLESVREDGGVWTAAAGVDGRTAGILTWLVEVRLLDYGFDGFDEEWNRLLTSGYIGLAF